jgi:hypothetical protein
LAFGLLAFSLSPAASVQAQGSSRIAPKLGGRLGGRADLDYGGGAGRRLQRVRDKAATRLGAEPTANLQLPGGTRFGFYDTNHYESVRGAGVELMRRYPPDSHLFVGVGRSPVSITSFLRELDPDLAMTFPASDLRQGILQKEAYFEHFRELLPKDVLNGERAIVLFDRSHDQSGSTLAALKQLLEEFMQREGLQGRVKAVGFARQGPLRGGVEHIDSTQWPLLFHYYNGRDEDEKVAPFRDKHQIGAADMSAIQENPLHEQLLVGLRARMKADEQLDQILTGELAAYLKDANGKATTAETAKREAPKAADGPPRAKRWDLQRFERLRTGAQGAFDERPLTLANGDEQVTVLDRNDYTQLKTAALRLIERAHEDGEDGHRHYVGVGRSSSAAMAVLEELGADASYLPADKIGKYKNGITAEIEQAFFAYFDRFIPRNATQSGTVVLFHRSDSGESLPLVEGMLRKYLDAKGAKTKVEIAALSPSGGGDGRVDVSDLQRVDKLGGDYAEAVARHPLHQVGVDEALQKLPRSANYDAVRQQVREFMLRDNELHEYLAAPAE